MSSAGCPPASLVAVADNIAYLFVCSQFTLNVGCGMSSPTGLISLQVRAVRDRVTSIQSNHMSLRSSAVIAHCDCPVLSQMSSDLGASWSMVQDNTCTPGNSGCTVWSSYMRSVYAGADFSGWQVRGPRCQ